MRPKRVGLMAAVLFSSHILRERILSNHTLREIRIPTIHLGVQSIVEGAIEIVCVGALEHHGQVFTIGPVGLLPELSLYAIEKLSARQRVRDGNTNIIGAGISNQADCILNIFPGFAGITEL